MKKLEQKQQNERQKREGQQKEGRQEQRQQGQIAGRNRLGEWTLQILFPRRCPVCDGIVRPAGKKICGKCVGRLRKIEAPWCMRCGKKLQEEAQYCPECREQDRAYVRGRALYEYASAAPSIYRFKYGNRREYGVYFGEEMAAELGSFIRKVEPDGLIPIPLHWKRLRSRGYNQAQILAEEIGRLLQIPVYSKLLKRRRNTVPMKKLNGAERQNNLKRAFNVAGNDVKLKRVIIVDDIYTTGTTIEEAASVLKKAGVEEVYFVTLSAV